METSESNNDKKKIKKIGTFTIGLCLILLGVAIFVSLFIGIKVLKYVFFAWPIIIILIGAEILYYGSKKGIELKYDFFGTLLLIIIFFGSIMGSMFYSLFDKVTDKSEPYITEYIEEHFNNNR